MKKLRFLIFLVAAVLSGATVQAQQGDLRVSLNYQWGIPTGNLKNLTSDVSPRGWSGYLSYGITNQIAVGLEVGFQDFYQKYPRQVLHAPGSDVSAVITNSIQTMPVLLKGKYTFKPEAPVQPYAALGIGGNLVQYKKYYGQFVDEHSSFGFAAQPEVGLHVPVGREKSAGLHIAAAYNYMPFKEGDADGLSHASVKAGVSIPLR